MKVVTSEPQLFLRMDFWKIEERLYFFWKVFLKNLDEGCKFFKSEKVRCAVKTQESDEPSLQRITCVRGWECSLRGFPCVSKRLWYVMFCNACRGKLCYFWCYLLSCKLLTSEAHVTPDLNFFWGWTFEKLKGGWIFGKCFWKFFWVKLKKIESCERCGAP